MKTLLALMLVATLLGCTAEGVDQDAVEASAAASDQPRSALSLTRLACGTLQIPDLSTFSIAGKYKGVRKTLADSCYLIRHGDKLMLWDTGLPGELAAQGEPVDGASLKRTIVDQLKQLGLEPGDIDLVGISHFHGDHTGQLARFPNARLLTGAGDWAAISADEPEPRIQIEPYAHWLSGGGEVQPVQGDLDVFGDGTVVMLALPGHTPGHHGLKVELPQTGTVLLSGDVTHFAENYESNGVPTWNTDKQASVESIKRFKQIAAETDALVIIQHEPDDIAKLPVFPTAAE